MLGIIVEKPSARKNFEKALGGNRGVFNGEEYIIRNSLGHVYQLSKDFHKQVDPALSGKYTKWDLTCLPWHAVDLNWVMEPTEGSLKTIDDMVKAFKGCDEIVIATDNDPSGEGEMIAWEIISQRNIRARKYSRMYFEDESPKSIQKAFKERKTLGTSIDCMYDDPDYRKAQFRTKWDFISIQWTRIASIASRNRAILRNGRLKSAMMVIVGDQLDAIRKYTKKPYFEQAFRDENGVVYLEEKGTRYDNKEDVPDVYSDSPVVVRSKVKKNQGPPAFLDLAGLSAILATKGIPAQTVLDTYQRMYEDSVVSYPRTEDKCITLEQFNELDAYVYDIAEVVGINPELLTKRSSPRKTHIKTGLAHGANRPGSNVPRSLASLDSTYGTGAREIYEILAKGYLATLCDDYEYEHQEGYLEKYPDFKGSSNVPLYPGWKAVYDFDVDEPDEENHSGLGTNASPFVKEGANKKPSAPTMKWLMKQLEKREVGTGATRTKTYADITNKKDKYPLMSEKKGKISFTDFGELNYSIIKGTHIADLSITEMVMKQMEQVAAGDDAQKYLDQIEGLIMEDIKKMAENAGFTGYAGKRTGIWKETGKEISFKTEWGGHTFTEEEQDRLLNGETITFTVKKDDAERSYTGKLEKQEYNGHNYVGFNANFAKGSGNSGSSNKANATGMTCPRCGKPINKLTWGYGCSGYSSGCSFRVGNTFNGKKLTDKQIRDLITKGKTSKPLKLVSKAGNEYEAYLVLNGPEEKYPVGMEFANKKR